MYVPLPPLLHDPREDEIDAGTGRGTGWRAERSRRLEMRDVRRDGLIEALLIAFTPPRGLPYLPGVSIVSTFSRRIRAEAVFWRTPFPIFLPHRRPSSPFSASPVRIFTHYLPHHGLHHRAFHLHLIQLCSRRLFRSLHLSFPLLLLPLFLCLFFSRLRRIIPLLSPK